MVKWEIASSFDRDYIIEYAKLLGWGENPPRVQVKRIPGMVPGEYYYIVEPYEEDCNCPNLLHFGDYSNRDAYASEGQI